MSKLRIVATIDGERSELKEKKQDLINGSLTLDDLLDIEDCELTIEGDAA